MIQSRLVNKPHAGPVVGLRQSPTTSSDIQLEEQVIKNSRKGKLNKPGVVRGCLPILQKTN